MLHEISEVNLQLRAHACDGVKWRYQLPKVWLIIMSVLLWSTAGVTLKKLGNFSADPFIFLVMHRAQTNKLAKQTN